MKGITEICSRFRIEGSRFRVQRLRRSKLKAEG
jgi:hypothetical protein